MSIVPGRSALQVSVNMSIEGRLYCYAAPFNSSILSPLYVKQKGAFALVTGKNLLNTVSITGLSPSTWYDVYVYAESLLGQGMDLFAVRATLARVTTACCSSIYFVTKYSSLLHYNKSTATAVDSNLFTFSLDFTPNQPFVVNVSAVAIACDVGILSGSSRATALPSSFSFGPSSLSLRGSFVLHGSAGCYTVTVFPIYASSTRNVSAPVTLYSSANLLPDPTITSAVFSIDGSMLLIDFDSPTNYDAGVVTSPYSQFPCDKVLSFVGATYATCKWTSSHSLIAIIDGTRPAPSAGDPVMLLSSFLRPTARIMDQAAVAATVLVQSTLNPSLPVVVLSTASTIGACDDLVLDPTASSGSGGRPWFKVQWIVSGSGAPATAASSISVFLNTYYNTSTRSVITVPKSIFSPDGSLTISLLLQNFLGASSASTSSITILSSTSIPQVKIPGSSQLSFFRGNSLHLFASAAASSCDNASSLALTYSWKVYQDATYLPSIFSTSLNNRVFLLPSFSLNVLTRYTVRVTVTTVSGVSNSDSVLVYVERSGVQAMIAGGTQRKVSSLASLKLDASASYDIDYPTSSNLTYSWSCFVTAPLYGSPCKLSLPTKAVLTFLPRTRLADTTYNFTVTVLSLLDGTFSSSSVFIVIFSQPLPSVSFNGVNLKFNAGDRIIVSATVNASSPFFAIWSCPGNGVNLTAIARSPLSVSFSAGLISVFLAITPNSLTAGLTYAFQLSAGYKIAPTILGSASLNVVANGPPYGGSLSVSPLKGYAAATYFSFSTYDWIDSPSDYPLQYSMGYYYSSTSSVLFVQSSSQVSYTSTYLGQGLVSTGYEVVCVVYSSDIYGAMANTTTAVIVFAFLSLHTLKSALSQRLDEAAATLNPDLTSSVVNAVSLSLNAANCTLAPDCMSLNRTLCTTVAQTCGDGLNGFLGVDGPSNSPCKLSTALRTTGSSCLSDSDCVSHSCVKGICGLSAKQCSANCTSHVRGVCVYVDVNGLPLDFCDANDLTCQSKCSCHAGWYGIDCSWNREQYETVVGMREKMCVSYYLASQLQVCNLKL